MINFSELINSLKTEDVAGQLVKISKSKKTKEEYISIVNTLKSMQPSNKEDIGIVAMYLADNCSETECEIGIQVFGYSRPADSKVCYDISNASWEDVLGMPVSEASLANILPEEVAAAIIAEITIENSSSPADGEIIKITESNFVVSRDYLYKALGVNDDRSDNEKALDKKLVEHSFSKMISLIFGFITAEAN